MFLPRVKTLICWLPIALLLMGGENTCTVSRLPLTERDQGFVDPSIMGIWSENAAVDHIDLDSKPEEAGYEPDFELGFDDSGNLKIVEYGKEGAVDAVYTGFTSVISGRRYLNVSLTACASCDEEELAKIYAGTCPFQIWQYSKELPPALLQPQTSEDFQLTADRIEEIRIAISEGPYLLIAYMSNEFVGDAINDGLIEGDPDCDECSSAATWRAGACITAEQTAIQKFVTKYDAQLYPADNWGIFMKVPSGRPE